MAFENSIRVMQVFAKKQIADTKNKAKGSNLANEITATILGSFEDEPRVKFTMPDYTGFMDMGVKGTGQKFKNGKPLKMKTQLQGQQSAFAKAIFGFNKTPSFSGNFKMINPSAIDKWTIQKGIEGTRDAKGRFVSRQGIKTAIATSIYRQGLGQGGSFDSIAGTGFFSITLEKNIKELTINLGKSYAKDLIDNLKTQDYFV
jgi:hypothetical protein